MEYKKSRCIGERSTKRLTEKKGINNILKKHIDRIMHENVEVKAKQCHLVLIVCMNKNKKLLPKLHQVSSLIGRIN